MKLPKALAYHLPILLVALGLGLCVLIVSSAARQQAPTGPTPGQIPTAPSQGLPRSGTPGMATADSNNQMIAVTGVDLTGSSILYLIDTQNRQLAVYQANGGSESTQGLKLVGARRIDLDLQLYGFNDKSEYSYEELQKRFAGLKPAAPSDH